MGNTNKPNPNDRPEHDEHRAAPPATPASGSGPYTASDLPIDEHGRIYHLQLKPEQIAPDILLVGDPGRAELIGSEFLHDIEVEHEHRGLVTVTGISEITEGRTTIISPLRTTVSTSGIGTPSLEIVLSELVALNEIDFSTRTHKADFPRLHVIRVGTSGALQGSTKLGTPIITTYAVGLDNTGLFYEVPYPEDTCKRLEEELGVLIQTAMMGDSRFLGKIHPYVSQAAPTIVEALGRASETLGVATKLGLTVSACGFFAPQGRDISRVKPSLPDLDKILSEYDPGLNGQRIENMEMEASFLIHYLSGLGHRAGAICAAIANRREDTFDHDYQQTIRNAIRVALLALADLRSRETNDRMN